MILPPCLTLPYPLTTSLLWFSATRDFRAKQTWNQIPLLGLNASVDINNRSLSPQEDEDETPDLPAGLGPVPSNSSWKNSWCWKEIWK